ncbi:hypothetical protein ACRQ5Q_22470 [Bradyrhizobium sp. PMVTL-01]|uniref:hypothetical protein n=1 Tax=Bradyrhizobium sp. PMVTL-01 TaxID=3434999 RepID=UPI003F6F2B87
MNPLLPHLAKEGVEADRLVDAFNLLLRECLDPESPHEFELTTVRNHEGKSIQVKRFPAEWARRLARAAETRAFRKMEPAHIVQRILTTEEPAHA